MHAWMLFLRGDFKPPAFTAFIGGEAGFLILPLLLTHLLPLPPSPRRGEGSERRYLNFSRSLRPEVLPGGVTHRHRAPQSAALHKAGLCGYSCGVIKWLLWS